MNVCVDIIWVYEDNEKPNRKEYFHNEKDGRYSYFLN